METAVQSDSDCLEQFTFVLAIKQFNMCVNQECISSEYFEADVLFDTRWRLQLYPRGIAAKDSKYISCTLSRADDDEGPESITIRVTMGLIDKDSKEQETRVLKDKKFQYNSTHGFRHFLELETLFKVKDCLLPNKTLTIFCRMERVGLQETLGFFRAKNIGYKRNKFDWSVQAFSKCSENEKKTTIVQFDTEPKTQLEMSLYVADGTVKIEIRRIGKSKTESVATSCWIIVMSSAGDLTEFSEEGHHSFKKDHDDVWLFPSFLKTNDLNNPTLLPGDILTLFCDFTIKSSGEESRIEEIDFANWELPPLDTALISQYRNMECLYDVELRVGENETVSANKFLLQSSSPVFKKMLENDKDTSTLDINDVDKDTLMEMTNFVYLKELDQRMEFDTLVKLFSAAHKYQMSALKGKCFTLLMSSLTVRNACEVLVVAHAHTDRMLWEGAINLISVNWIVFSLSEDWEHLIYTRKDLARETRIFIRKKIFG